MSDRPVIVGLGEALFDLFPQGAKLGGAPLNLAVHAHLLGNTGVVVSRVGRDDLARGVIDELRNRGMTTQYIQADSRRPTGTVRVDVDDRGEPHFIISNDVAWDALEFDGQTEELARHCDAVAFGTLAQRSPVSRATIQQFLESAGKAVRLFDVNLRQHYFDRPTIKRSCELATAMKLNESELEVLGELLGLGTGQEKVGRVLLELFDIQWVAVTLGARGMVVYAGDGRHEGESVPAPAGGDAVGAGDAAAAGLLHGAVRGWSWERTITLANALGAHVASQAGACPPHTPELAAMAR